MNKIALELPAIELEQFGNKCVRVYADGELVAQIDLIGIKKVRVRTHWEETPFGHAFRSYVNLVCKQLLEGSEVEKEVRR